MEQIHWYFKEGDKEVEIPVEPWIWNVIYKDGTELSQFDTENNADGKRYFHQFKEIKQDEVLIFQMVSLKNPALRYSIDKTDDVSQIFHFYRRGQRTDGAVIPTLYVFGYKHGSTSFYHFIMPDDRLVISTNKDIKLLI